MQPTTRQVYFLSNGTAITAETLGTSLLAQFPDHSFQTHTVPFVDTLDGNMRSNSIPPVSEWVTG